MVRCKFKVPEGFTDAGVGAGGCLKDVCKSVEPNGSVHIFLEVVMRTMKSIGLLAGLAVLGLAFSSANAAPINYVLHDGDMEAGTVIDSNSNWGSPPYSMDVSYFGAASATLDSSTFAGGASSLKATNPNPSGSNFDDGVQVRTKGISVPAGDYTISFDYKNDGSGYFAVNGLSSGGLTADGIPSNSNWTHYTFPNPSFNNSTAQVIYVNFYPQGAGTLWLDNVTITAVPEPASALLLGLPALALGLRRRRR